MPPGILAGILVAGTGGKVWTVILTGPTGIPETVYLSFRISLENASFAPVWQTKVTRPLGNGSPLNLT
jgi:hypothetical protein